MEIENPTGYIIWAAITIALVGTGSYGIDLFTGKDFNLRRRWALIVAVGIMLNAGIALAFKDKPDPNWQIIIAGGVGIFLDQIIAKRSQLLQWFAARNPGVGKAVGVIEEEEKKESKESAAVLHLDRDNGNKP